MYMTTCSISKYFKVIAFFKKIKTFELLASIIYDIVMAQYYHNSSYSSVT